MSGGDGGNSERLLPLGELRPTLQGNRLLLDYSLENPLEERLYVLNSVVGERPTDDGWEATTPASTAFVCHEHEDLALLFQGPLPGVGLEPGVATPLDPGSRLVAQLGVPLPLCEWHAGAPPRPHDTCQIVTIRRVRLRIAFACSSEVEVEPLRTCPDAFTVHGRATGCFEAMTLLPIPCELQRRLDDFFRFA